MDRLSPVSAVSGKRLAVRKSQVAAAGAWGRLPKADCRHLNGRCPGGLHLAPEMNDG